MIDSFVDPVAVVDQVVLRLQIELIYYYVQTAAVV